MASTFELSSHSYDGRYMYVTCTQTKDISSNASIINWTLVVTGGKSELYNTGPTTLKINGETVYYKRLVEWSEGVFPAAKGSVSGSITVNHNATGDATVSVSLSTNIYIGVVKTQTAQWTLDSIPRFATITAAPNFNDEQNPTITYSNPAGTSATSLRACITLDGTVADIEYRDVSKTGNSYTFNLTNAERDVLRAATTGGNSRSVGFYLRTEIGGSVDASKVWRTLTIKNPNPTIAPTIKDVNSATVALTGNNNKLVRYYSNAHVIIDAQAVKKATLTSQKVACGNKSLNGDGTIEAVESGTFVFTATDSRGNTTKKTVATDFVEYVKLSCLVGNAKPNTEGQMTFKVDGSYFSGSFGAATNTLSVYYRYKVSGGSYGNWTAMNVTVGSSGNYSAYASLTGLDYQTAYVFQAYAVDKLATVYSSEKVVKAAPVFDWGESDFKFNVPVYDQFGTKIGSGLAAYTGGGDSGIDPNTTLEELCLTSHTNAPQGLGTFYYIRTVFYNTKSATANRSQFAIPYKAGGHTYYRCYNSGAWTPWQMNVNASDVANVVRTSDILNLVFPVGSYYIAGHTTSPASLFGGSWHRIESRFLYACAASGTVGLTGGSATHTHALGDSAYAQINHHNGAFWFKEIDGVSYAASGKGSADGSFVTDAQTSAVPLAGSTNESSNMPPYVNVAIWRRTA